ncbi:MAG TPA: BamA/TamA family outer membrane protein [Thermoanaerobaculia bacterium]|nr:BamA/TamA family outer membrane protein [Thermoanaerobaculia bacterium]
MIRRSIRLSALALAALALGASLPSALHAQAQIGPQWGGSGFGKNKVQYRDFDWQIYHSPHFNVHYYSAEEPSLQKVVSFAESAYDQLSREFNFQIKDPVPLIFYATHSAFEQNNIILNFIPEGVGAFATPARFRMVLPIDMPDPELMELILHELTHIFQYHMLFQGSLGKAVAATPPTWFMEGMASYMAKDESARDKMFLRDAVVNDNLPSITQNFGGFFAYRYGHALFDFVEERWGKEGFLDFIYELRNTIGARVDRAVERAFKLDAEEFDIEFRRWLRRKYLSELVETGEPSDFGRRFRNEEAIGQNYATSPVASPSGDLIASFNAYRGDIDVILYDTEKRTFLRSLTKDNTNDYQYLVAQELTLGREMGRDLAFSPDGNYLAVFAKRERGRSLLLLDVLNGGVHRIYDMDEIEQQIGPAWSPDGRTIAFSGNRNGKFDIFLLDVESGSFRNFTDDNVFDAAPAFSPDGKSLVYVSVVGKGHAKLFRSSLDQPARRFQLTTGEWNENDPTFSPDGQRLYFTSDRDGRENIYSLDLTGGELRQYTNVVTGAFMPTVLREPDGEERLVFTGFWKGLMDLYVADVDEPVREPETVQIPQEPAQGEGLEGFEPDIQVTIDEANRERYGGFKFFLEGAESFVGVDDDQTYVGRVVLSFSDYLGDRRIIADLSSVDSFSNFNILYADLSGRLQWQARLFDNREYYTAVDTVRGELVRDQKAYAVTGATASIVYPFSFYQRAEIGGGYLFREYSNPVVLTDPLTGQQRIDYREISDDFPLLQGALVGDSARFASFGPIAGRRWRMDAMYAPDLDGSGTLIQSVDLDVRQYIPVTLRSNVAMRVFAGDSEGNAPIPVYFGGLDTIRGTRFRELVGDRGFFANVEYRFPLIDFLRTPILNFQGIRGVAFFDIGSAWLKDDPFYDFYDNDEGRLVDGVASYGFGVTVRFLGLDLNWDFAQRWDLKEKLGSETAFWIGSRF